MFLKNKFYKNKFYPVNINKRIIYNDPQTSEGKCSLNSDKYRDKNTIGIKGRRLNENIIKISLFYNSHSKE